MKMHAYIAGVGMTRFGKHLDVKLKHLAGEAIREALTDAGIASSEIQAAYMGNAAAGVLQGFRGEVNSPLYPISRHVLTKVDQLQPGANRI